MNKKTKTALLKSIKHWEENAKHTSKDLMKLGTKNCALCQIFYHRYTSKVSGCVGCPVSEKTGRMSCINTPYDIFEDFNSLDDPINWQEEALKELEFLKSLLPKEENNTPTL